MLGDNVPRLDVADAESQLMQLADEISRSKLGQPEASPPACPIELDVSQIVRPEQFFTQEVTCLVVPIAINAGGKPAARWMMNLRWVDGRRECLDMTTSIRLDDGRSLWIHPEPTEPSVTSPSGWAPKSRRAWQAGAAVPNPADVFARICERIAEFIDLPQDVAAGTTATLAIWALLSYVYQAWDAVPYLFVGGPLGSGKSRVFDILARLVFRPLVSSNLTAPALFRTLHDRGGVLLFDEAERLRQSTPDVAEILSMLLAGYKRGGQAIRLEAVGDSFRTIAFDVYGPKALACIAGLPPALASRTVQVMMFRAPPDSVKPKRRIDEDLEGLFEATPRAPEQLDQHLQRELAMLPDPPPGVSPQDLPDDWLEEYGPERVAIMVEDGKLPLEHAEAKALADVLLVMKRADTEPPE